MRKSILNMVKSRYLNEEMQKWYDQFEERTSDEVLSREDTEALRKQYENIYNEAQNKINGMLAAAGVGLEGASAVLESSKKRVCDSFSRSNRRAKRQVHRRANSVGRDQESIRDAKREIEYIGSQS